MSKRGHVPIRRCMGCRRRREKNAMLRFILTDKGDRLVAGGKRPKGRGFYLCPDVSCLRAAKKRYRFELTAETKEEKE